MHVERIEIIRVLVDKGREDVDLAAVTYAHGTDLARCGTHRRCLEIDSNPFVLAVRRSRLRPERPLQAGVHWSSGRESLEVVDACTIAERVLSDGGYVLVVREHDHLGALRDLGESGHTGDDARLIVVDEDVV